MFASRGFKAALFFLTIALMLGFQSHHLSHAETDSDSASDGTSVSATATGYKYGPDHYGHYHWTAWAGFSAFLSKAGRRAGYSVRGSYDLYAYMPGGGVKRDSNSFTLTIKRFLGVLWLMDDSRMGNISSVTLSSGSGNPGGNSTARVDAGASSTKTCRWP